jgi:Tol biopolymer transport system component
MYRLIVAISLGLALIQAVKLAGDQKASPPASAQEVTGAVQKYDELLPKCSPDGRWLAFEYHETSDPNYPRVGIMDLSQDSHPWHPLLEAKPGRHLYAGDFSWSPDSQWLALWTDYPEGRKSFWSDGDVRLARVNVRTHEVVRLTDALPEGARVGPTTAWLRSGTIVFSGLTDDNIYGVSQRGGKPRKIATAPKDKCGGGTNTLAVSPDERRIAFAIDADGDGQIAECNALWIAAVPTGNLRRVPTTGLHPLSPFWLDKDTILFSGEKDNKPVGIYKLSLITGNLTRLLEGHYLTPFVCDSDRKLYFSWGPMLEAKTPSGDAWPTFNDFSGFHIWKVPLADVLRQHEEHSEVTETVDPKTGNIHLQIPIPAPTKKQ